MQMHACMLMHACTDTCACLGVRTHTHTCTHAYTHIHMCSMYSHAYIEKKSNKSHIIAKAALKEQIKFHQNSNWDCGHYLDTG